MIEKVDLPFLLEHLMSWFLYGMLEVLMFYILKFLGLDFCYQSFRRRSNSGRKLTWKLSFNWYQSQRSFSYWTSIGLGKRYYSTCFLTREIRRSFELLGQSRNRSTKAEKWLYFSLEMSGIGLFSNRQKLHSWTSWRCQTLRTLRKSGKETVLVKAPYLISCP